jgi:hypothetical protein
MVEHILGLLENSRENFGFVEKKAVETSLGMSKNC